MKTFWDVSVQDFFEQKEDVSPGMYLPLHIINLKESVESIMYNRGHVFLRFSFWRLTCYKIAICGKNLCKLFPINFKDSGCFGFCQKLNCKDLIFGSGFFF